MNPNLEFEKLPEENSQNSEDIEHERIENVEDLLGKLPFQRYFIFSTLFVGLGLVSEGIEIALMSILNVIYQRNLHMSSTAVAYLVSTIFLGLLVGCAVSGYFGDRFGRKKTMYISMIILFIPSVASAFMVEYYQVFIIRVFSSFCIGVNTPIAYTFTAELSQKKMRGYTLVLCSGFWSLGGAYTGLVCWLLADTVQEVNWRALIIIVSIPMLISGIMILIYVEESPRYILVFKKDRALFKKTMEKIQEKNKSQVEITEVDYDKLEEWAHNHEESHGNGDWGQLFNEKNLKTTLVLNFMWFMEVYVYYSVIFLAPTLHSSHNKNKTSTFAILINNSGEIISCVLALLTIENRNFKRKKSIIFGLLLAGVLFLAEGILFSTGKIGVTIWILLTILRIILFYVFTIIEPLTVESYETQARAAGDGFAHSICRIAGAIMPLLNNLIRIAGIAYIFYFCGLVSLLTPIVLGKYLKETFGKNIN